MTKNEREWNELLEEAELEELESYAEFLKLKAKNQKKFDSEVRRLAAMDDEYSYFNSLEIY